MTLRDAWNALVPFLFGIVLGMAGTLATFSGRIATLETVAAAHAETLREIRSDLRTLGDGIRSRQQP